MIVEFLIFFATILGLHCVYLLWNRDYWEKRGVFCPKSDLLLGNVPGQVTGKKNMFYELDDFYKKFKRNYPYIGIFNFRSPKLLVLDPEIIRDILVKYFKYFQGNELTDRIDTKSDPLFGNHSFFLTGDAWKAKRAEISPAFSNSRVSWFDISNFEIFFKTVFECSQIKALFPIFFDVCNQIGDYIQKQTNSENFEAFDCQDVGAS